MSKMQKIFGDTYNFFPTTWILPHEVEAVKSYLGQQKGRCVIVKPAGGAQVRFFENEHFILAPFDPKN